MDRLSLALSTSISLRIYTSGLPVHTKWIWASHSHSTPSPGTLQGITHNPNSAKWGISAASTSTPRFPLTGMNRDLAFLFPMLTQFGIFCWMWKCKLLLSKGQGLQAAGRAQGASATLELTPAGALSSLKARGKPSNSPEQWG